MHPGGLLATGTVPGPTEGERGMRAEAHLARFPALDEVAGHTLRVELDRGSRPGLRR